jgi:hypothetical protein
LRVVVLAKMSQIRRLNTKGWEVERLHRDESNITRARAVPWARQTDLPRISRRPQLQRCAPATAPNNDHRLQCQPDGRETRVSMQLTSVKIYASES